MCDDSFTASTTRLLKSFFEKKCQILKRFSCINYILCQIFYVVMPVLAALSFSEVFRYKGRVCDLFFIVFSRAVFLCASQTKKIT